MRTKAMKVGCLLLVWLAAAAQTWAAGQKEASTTAQKLLPLSCMIWDRNKVPPEKGTVEDNKWTRWIKEQVKAEGIDLKFIAVPRSGDVDRMNVMLASNTAPDIIYCEHMYLIAGWAPGLTDLTEPLAKYGPDLVKYLGPEIIECGQLAGVQYAIPSYRHPMDNSHAVGHIRQDWLDKLKLAMPKNTTELAYVLKQFKQKDPAGVGVDNVVPWGKFRKTTNLWYSNELSHDIMYSFMDHSIEKLYTTPEPLREGFKDWMKWCNDLYHSGCIDKEFATRTSEESTQQFMRNQVGFYPNNAGAIYSTSTGYVANVRKIAPEARWVGCAPYAGKDGVARHMLKPPHGYFNIVPATCKYPEAAIKYMQWQVRPDILQIQALGFEGEHFEWTDDGYPAAAGIKNGKPFDYSKHHTEDYGYIKNDAKIMGDFFYGAEHYWKAVRNSYTRAYDAQTAQDVIDERRLALSNGYPQPTFRVEIKAWTKYGAELKKAYDEYWVRCVVATDFEKEYADFQKELKLRGIDEYAAERKAYYDKYVRK